MVKESGTIWMMVRWSRSLCHYGLLDFGCIEQVS